MMFMNEFDCAESAGTNQELHDATRPLGRDASGDTGGVEMSKWRHGCGKPVTVYIPKGWDYVARERECGSTAIDGGVNQCDECAATGSMPPAREDESDMDYVERTEG